MNELKRRIEADLEPLRSDLLWVMSRAGQELFHSNTLGFLMERYPVASVPLRRLFEGDAPSGPVQTWRELRHLDLVGRSAMGRYVMENKLYSIPYPEQLRRYLTKSLPWERDPGPGGATGTTYVLLSLMEPSFALPSPWIRRSYEEVAAALRDVSPADLGDDCELFVRYRAMVERLIRLKDAVDPRRHPSEPFSVTPLIGDPDLGWFAGPLQRMRYTGLLELAREHITPLSDFGVGLSNTRGRADYYHWLSRDRAVGWQLQGDDLRLVVLFQDGRLRGKGKAKKDLRAEAARESWLDYFDFSSAPTEVRSVLAPGGGTKAGSWNHYDPDFVYRYRKVSAATSAADLASALAALIRRAENWDRRDG